jgi:hypothetical protein
MVRKEGGGWILGLPYNKRQWEWLLVRAMHDEYHIREHHMRIYIMVFPLLFNFNNCSTKHFFLLSSYLYPELNEHVTPVMLLSSSPLCHHQCDR